MRETYRFFGWEMSLYSGKLRAYLRHKNIPYEERRATLWDMRQIRRETGAQVMPVLVTPEGEWLQDTSHIIDVLEGRFPQAPVVPDGPRQRIAAYLLEAWGAEFWLASAMHYRWHFAQNYREIFQPEGGDNLLPYAPRWLKNRVIERVAMSMRSFLPGLGVLPDQVDAIEAWSEHMCDALDRHFAEHRYLLGGRPSLGDYGLIGPLYAHLGRDPYPATHLIAARPHLAAWIERMQQPDGQDGEFLPDDAIAATLAPLFESVFGEFWTYLEATREALEKVPEPAPGRGYSRALGEVSLSLVGRPFRCKARPFSLWMLQRAQEAYAHMDSTQQATVDTWLSDYAAEQAMHGTWPRLQRMALHVRPTGEGAA